MHLGREADDGMGEEEWAKAERKEKRAERSPRNTRNEASRQVDGRARSEIAAVTCQ